MGQIIGGAAKPKRCNINQLSQLGTPAAGEHILVSSDNSMNAAGQGNFDCYIEGNGTDAAMALTLNPLADKDPISGSKNSVTSGGVYKIESSLGNELESLEYIALSGKVTTFSGKKALILNASGNNCAALYVGNMIGETLIINSTQYSSYSVCYTFSSLNASNGTLYGSGTFTDGVADRVEVVVPTNAKWLYVNYDPSTTPTIARPTIKNLLDFVDDVKTYEEDNLIMLTTEEESGSYATTLNGNLYTTNNTQSKILIGTINSSMRKLFVNTTRIKDLSFSNSTTVSYVIVDSSNVALQYESMSEMTYRGAISIPSGASKIYVNADLDDTDCFIGYFMAETSSGSSSDDTRNRVTLELATLSPESGFATESQSKIQIYSNSGSIMTKIPISSIPTSTIYITAETLASPFNLLCIFGDRSGNSLGYYRDSENASYDNYEVTIPDDAFYLYINSATSSTPKVTATLSETEANAYIMKKSINGSLWDKSCVCFGDSITWYDGNAYNWGKENGTIAKGYESYMREVGMVVNNQGYSGANITFILSKIRSTDVSSYDFVTITSGANDSRYQIPVGELAESGSQFDETTFIGALQAGIEYILTNNLTAKILLMTPIKGWIYYPNGYVNSARPLVSGDGIVEKRYADAIKAVAEYYSLPVCDWYNEAGVNLLTRSWFMNDPEPDPTATPNPNDLYSLHPTTAGYKRMAELLIPCLRNM